jgi:hypothetical protein
VERGPGSVSCQLWMMGRREFSVKVWESGGLGVWGSGNGTLLSRDICPYSTCPLREPRPQTQLY